MDIGNHYVLLMTADEGIRVYERSFVEEPNGASERTSKQESEQESKWGDEGQLLYQSWKMW